MRSCAFATLCRAHWAGQAPDVADTGMPVAKLLRGSQLDLDENDVAEILVELYGEAKQLLSYAAEHLWWLRAAQELELDAVPWTYQLASRGETRCLLIIICL